MATKTILITSGSSFTTPSDLATAMTFIGDAQSFRTGVGTDAHAFGEGRELWLAGLSWPGEVGVDGHSDGDVAAHAICDALFAATSTGDASDGRYGCGLCATSNPTASA